MRASRDHILTSQSGSLPRPDDLIEANRQRDAGAGVDEQRFQDQLRAAVDRRRAPPARDRDRRAGRRRVRQIDGAPGQLRGVVELLLQSPGRARSRPAARACTSCRRGAAGPGEIALTSMADRRDRMRFPGVYADPEGPASDRAAAAPPGRSASVRSPTKGRTPSRPTSPISRRRSRPAASKKAS